MFQSALTNGMLFIVLKPLILRVPSADKIKGLRTIAKVLNQWKTCLGKIFGKDFWESKVRLNRAFFPKNVFYLVLSS